MRKQDNLDALGEREEWERTIIIYNNIIKTNNNNNNNNNNNDALQEATKDSNGG